MIPNLKIAIRADSGQKVGMGHMMRCSNLADALVERGAQVQFISEYLIDEVDWLIIDHYGLGIDYERLMRSHAKKIMVIDDLNRAHDCDLLFGPVWKEPYYALLSKEYRQFRDKVSIRQGVPKRVLISFGGSNFDEFAQKSSNIVRMIAGLGIEIEVIDSTRPKKSLASLNAWADMAIGACGVSAWERICLGLPSLVVTIADNQVESAQDLNFRGLIRWVGGFGKDPNWAQGLELELSSIFHLGLESSWSESCMAYVDGLGVERVANAIYQAS